jgi:hypothetical protein
MPFVSKQLIALTITVFMLAPIAVGAQTISPTDAAKNAGASTSVNGAAQLTGKERLGEKWKDEQRIDNCKVSLDKRGTKPRPVSCAHVPTG